MPEGRVFDECDIKVMIGGPAEGIPPECAEAALVGAGPAGNVNGDVEERAVADGAASEIVRAHRTAGGKMRHRYQVGAIPSSQAGPGLLHSGEYGEWRARGKRGDVENLPSTSQGAAQRAQQWQPIERQ